MLPKANFPNKLHIIVCSSLSLCKISEVKVKIF
jgi:hypothetical protein